MTPGPRFSGSNDCIFPRFITPLGMHNPKGRPASGLLRHIYETVYGPLPPHVLVKRPQCQNILRRKGRKNELLQCFNPQHASTVEIGTRPLPEDWHATQGHEYHVDPESGCWIWKMRTNQRGYGTVSIRGKNWAAHRAVYEKHERQNPTRKSTQTRPRMLQPVRQPKPPHTRNPPRKCSRHCVGRAASHVAETSNLVPHPKTNEVPSNRMDRTHENQTKSLRTVRAI